MKLNLDFLFMRFHVALKLSCCALRSHGEKEEESQHARECYHGDSYANEHQDHLAISALDGAIFFILCICLCLVLCFCVCDALIAI